MLKDFKNQNAKNQESNELILSQTFQSIFMPHASVGVE